MFFVAFDTDKQIDLLRRAALYLRELKFKVDPQALSASEYVAMRQAIEALERAVKITEPQLEAIAVGHSMDGDPRERLAL
jgi:hypothetical protein